MDAFPDDPLVQAVTAHVKAYMSHYDASHSWDHIERVVTTAHHIYNHSDPEFKATLDLRVIHLAALLHDVGDRKYLLPHEDPTTLITTTLLALSCPPPLAARIQTICSAVSYTHEVQNPALVTSLLASRPELAVVQDADRLDAIGAIGLGRVFTFGGAKGGRSMAGSMAHLDEKLVRLEGMMKTEVGRGMARVRGERLRVFREWWVEEGGKVEG
ncbi:hypothetical protein C8A05DRAFT_48099 [Staphylotrichum tortipilum]|uniref:HD/PDEase domain-containing protein n=1 Tax=Staphylotrichum tortipilum TaxID=2831512 RepID=A0AAN6M9Z9_9PEZI|nr:hypothetical protein C8A05DRAFT_48099 [Staphylotrichum longicolle]